MANEVERLAIEKLPCGYCGADPQERCMTATGRPAPTHGRRWSESRDEFFDYDITKAAYVRRMVAA